MKDWHNVKYECKLCGSVFCATDRRVTCTDDYCKSVNPGAKKLKILKVYNTKIVRKPRKVLMGGAYTKNPPNWARIEENIELFMQGRL